MPNSSTITDGKNQTTRWTYDIYDLWPRQQQVGQGGAEILPYTYEPNDRLTHRLRTSFSRSAV